jgi:cyanophycin synthetase
MGGAARFQVGNILAAIAAAYVQGVRYDDVRAGLLSFFPSPAMTPGRLNLLRVGEGRVIIDYAHNCAAMEALLEFALRLPAERRVGVIAVPGDRRDVDVRAVGRLAAQLDSVIIKEDDEPRGRDRGAVAELLREGLHEGGMSDDRIEVIHDETEAVSRALDRLDADTLGMVLAADVRNVLSLVEARARGNPVAS